MDQYQKHEDCFHFEYVPIRRDWRLNEIFSYGTWYLQCSYVKKVPVAYFLVNTGSNPSQAADEPGRDVRD
jgi:hypothetical protein